MGRGGKVAGALAAAGILSAGRVWMRLRKVELLPAPEGVESGVLGDARSPVLRLVVIGDSTASGVGGRRREETYPWRLAALLSRNYLVRLWVLAAAGARMRDAVAFAAEAAHLEADVVVIGIGGNDVTHLTPMGRVTRQLSSALAELEGRAGQVLVALGPAMKPPLLPWPLRHLVSLRARLLNRNLKKVARHRSHLWVDLRRELGAASRTPGYWAGDGFHPGPAGYRLWAQVLEGPVRGMLEKSLPGRPDSPDTLEHDTSAD